MVYSEKHPMTDVENLKSLHMWINSHCSTFCCILHCFVAFSVAIYRRCADLTKVSMPQTHIAMHSPHQCDCGFGCNTCGNHNTPTYLYMDVTFR